MTSVNVVVKNGYAQGARPRYANELLGIDFMLAIRHWLQFDRFEDLLHMVDRSAEFESEPVRYCGNEPGIMHWIEGTATG